ncbi:MAG TPA: hypothetical protein VFE91_03115, partial [Nitrososphaerales archaeon]|nr:hypothetical protein [Nitrososphaerales archaeon]
SDGQRIRKPGRRAPCLLGTVRQFLEGKELYDQAFEYVDRPTELEAYRATVAEARRVGMDEEEILRYLRLDAADDSELGKLMEKIGVRARR